MVQRNQKKMAMGWVALTVALILASSAPSLQAWDHPGHMTTAAIAFQEIAQARPDLIEPLGLLFMAHPVAGPFWVAAAEAKGEEAIRRKVIECGRWADDVKFTAPDQPTWHTARWAIVQEGAPSEVEAAAVARGGKAAGQALEALTLNFAMLSNEEATPQERALALCWVFHIVGDIHQPMHVSDLFTEDFPTGNAAATMSYVEDPLTEKPIPLHILWDSNVRRSPKLVDVDRYAQELMAEYPRSSFPELKAHSVTDSNAFVEWAQESHQVAVDWAYDLETLPDPAKDQDADALLQNMVKYILEGESHVEEAPQLPPGYWEKMQATTGRRIALAGYRIADLILSAAEHIEAQRKFVGR